MLPRVWFHEMKKYLSWGSAHHVKYYYAELYPNWGEGPKAWVLTKLLWNPDQNVDSLLEDWYVHAAGPKAAPKLSAFYSIWEKFWTEDIFRSKWNRNTGQYLPFSDPGYLSAVPASYLTESDALMQAALQLTETPAQKKRVEELNRMWGLYKAAVVAYQENHNSEGSTVKQSSVEASARLYDLFNELKKDPLLSSSIESMITRIKAYKKMVSKK
jgi:hypothetical protein